MSETTEQLTLRPDDSPILSTQPVPESAAMMILRMASDNTVDIERIKELMKIARELDADDARKQYHAAMAAFKKTEIVITKDRENLKYKSMYSTLGNIAATVNPILGKYGLSAGWKIDQQTKPGMVIVTCILTHAAGHSDTCTMEAPPDDSGGPNGMNAIQRIKSTRTYLENATYESILGLAPSDPVGNDDGNGFTNGDMALECKKIESTDTVEECVKVFQEAYKIQDAAKNKAGMMALLTSKNKRKAELLAAQTPQTYKAITETDRKKFLAIVEKSGATEADMKAVLKHAGYAFPVDITTQHYDALCKMFSNGTWAENMGGE